MSYWRGIAQVCLGQQGRSWWLLRPTTDEVTSSCGGATTLCRDELWLAKTQNLRWWFKCFLLLLSTAFFSQGQVAKWNAHSDAVLAIHLFEVRAGVDTCIFSLSMLTLKSVSLMNSGEHFFLRKKKRKKKYHIPKGPINTQLKLWCICFCGKTERQMQLLFFLTSFVYGR